MAAAPTLVFSHANGFPAGTYEQLFKAWRAAGWRVKAVAQFGHDPAYPVTSNWPRLRDQLIDFIEAEVKAPAWLVGHSLGGLLSLLAACRRPELVQGLVLLDSPVFTGWRAHSVRMLKLSGLIPRLSPAKVSRTRRHEWPSRQAALEHFRAKAVFARWEPQVLADYIGAGTRRAGGKTVLAFDRAVETHIYNTLPHHLGALMRRHPPRCPVGSSPARARARCARAAWPARARCPETASAGSKARTSTRWKSPRKPRRSCWNCCSRCRRADRPIHRTRVVPTGGGAGDPHL